MTIPPEWIEAGAKALRDEQHSTEMPWEQLDANSKSLYREDTQRALAAVLPLIVKSMMEPSERALHYGMYSVGDINFVPLEFNLKVSYQAMLRAWAHERGITATTTPEPQEPSTLD